VTVPAQQVGAPRLAVLQEWLAFVVRHPATADVAVRARAARAMFAAAAVRAGAVVKLDDRMPVTDRLQVYNGGYLARLVEVMAADYGGVQQLVGADRFQELVAGYVTAHPSRHPNLNQLGRRFPAFVRRQRSLPHRAFAAELAELELAMALAFDAEPCVPIDLGALQALSPARQGRVRFAFNPSVRLLACRYPTNGWFQAWKDEESPPPPALARTWVCVYRKDWRVFRLGLQARPFAVLRALATGQPLAAALGRAGGDPAVGTWFQTWAAEGLFAAVRGT
jgi:hypothetical protein